MCLLCIINGWHALISIIDELSLMGSADGYNVSTLLEHQTYLNASKQPGYNPISLPYMSFYILRFSFTCISGFINADG